MEPNRTHREKSTAIFLRVSFHFSSFPETKEQYPDFSLKNGGVAGGGGMELKRSIAAHCHGANKAAAACEDGGDKLIAKKKLYIASAVCLVFMIGEVIGEPALGQSRPWPCPSGFAPGSF